MAGPIEVWIDLEPVYGSLTLPAGAVVVVISGTVHG